MPSCGPLTSRKSSRVEISKKFTRSELEDAVRRKKRDDVAYNNHRATDHRATNHNAKEHLDSTSQQLRSLDLGVKLCARKYNEAKAQRLRIEEQVSARNDELAELERESKALSEMLQGSNPEARKIATLTDEIQQVVDSSSDLLTNRKQLQHMHLRLQNNSVALDAHLGEMADTVKVAQKEKNRSQKMLAELESGLTLASIQLDDTIQEISVLDEQRNHELTLKRAEASDADRRDMKNRTRVSSNIAMHASLADTSRSEREQLQRTLREHQLQMKDMRIKSIEVTAKLTSYEETFAHVKQATGVNSLTEMCQKMKHHAQQHRNLSSELSCAEERLKAARASLVKDKETLAQLKTNGLCTTELNREILDELKSSVKSEKADGKIVCSTNKRLEDLLVGLRQGGIGLYNRLLPFHSTFLSGEAPTLGVMDSTNAIQAASDTMEMISFTEKILANMIKVLGGIQFVDTKHVTAVGGGGDSPEKINLRVTPKVSDTYSVY